MAKAIYVKGAIRKDAVAIIPKDVRVTEARVLETLYKDAWKPRQVRMVEVAEAPTAQGEAERLVALYGEEAFENAYGKPVQARQALTEILALDSAAKVKASGLLLENDAHPIEVVGEDAPGKAGGKRKGNAVAASADSGGESAQAAE